MEKYNHQAEEEFAHRWLSSKYPSTIEKIMRDSDERDQRQKAWDRLWAESKLSDPDLSFEDRCDAVAAGVDRMLKLGK